MKNNSFAVLLLNMGGPSSLSDIKNFLYRLFSDKEIINIPFLQNLFAKIISSLRTPYVKKHYQKIGGKSPILELTTKQANKLNKELNKTVNSKVYIGMRYTKPTINDAVNNIINDNHNKLIVLPLYPHFSNSTSLSSINEFNRIIKAKQLNNMQIKIIYHWYDCPDYIKALSLLIKDKLNVYNNKNDVHIVFSAHSIPLSLVNKGDPYPNHINICVEHIINSLNCTNPHHICFQSKIGPIKWLEPSTKSVINNIAERKNQSILVVPISFVSDHYETNYEIDILYANQAKQAGIKHFDRINSLNDHNLFIKALSTIILNNIKD